MSKTWWAYLDLDCSDTIRFFLLIVLIVRKILKVCKVCTKRTAPIYIFCLYEQPRFRQFKTKNLKILSMAIVEASWVFLQIKKKTCLSNLNPYSPLHLSCALPLKPILKGGEKPKFKVEVNAENMGPDRKKKNTRLNTGLKMLQWVFA